MSHPPPLPPLPPSLPPLPPLSLCSKSTTGVGWFIVETESGAALRIHKAVDYWAKYIVDQIKSMGQRERTVSGCDIHRLDIN